MSAGRASAAAANFWRRTAVVSAGSHGAGLSMQDAAAFKPFENWVGDPPPGPDRELARDKEQVVGLALHRSRRRVQEDAGLELPLLPPECA